MGASQGLQGGVQGQKPVSQQVQYLAMCGSIFKWGDSGVSYCAEVSMMWMLQLNSTQLHYIPVRHTDIALHALASQPTSQITAQI